MLKPVSTIKTTCYPYYSGQKTFRGFYDPGCVSVTQDMKNLPHYNILEKLRHQLFGFNKTESETIIPEVNNVIQENSIIKNALNKFKGKYMPEITENNFNEAPSAVNNLIEPAAELEILDSRNIVNEATGENIHIMPDGTPFSYFTANTAVDSLPTEDLPVSDLMPDGTSTFIDMSVSGEDGVISGISEIIDKISDLL